MSEVAPYLRGSGTRQQVVLEGNRLVLSCLVGGSWPLQYRWTLNNSNVTDWTPQYRSGLTHSSWISPHPSSPPSARSLWLGSPSGRHSSFSLLVPGFRYSTALDTFGADPESCWRTRHDVSHQGPLSQSMTYLGVISFPCHRLSCQGQMNGGVKGVKLPDNWSHSCILGFIAVVPTVCDVNLSPGLRAVVECPFSYKWRCRAESGPDKVAPLCWGMHMWTACLFSPLFTAGQSASHCCEYIHSVSFWLADLSSGGANLAGPPLPY